MSDWLTDNTSLGPLSLLLSFTHPLAFIMSPSRRRHSHSFYLFVGLSSISCCNLMFALKLQASLFRRYVQSISYSVFIGKSRRRTHTKYTFQSKSKWHSQNKNHVIAYIHWNCVKRAASIQRKGRRNPTLRESWFCRWGFTCCSTSKTFVIHEKMHPSAS